MPENDLAKEYYFVKGELDKTLYYEKGKIIREEIHKK